MKKFLLILSTISLSLFSTSAFAEDDFQSLIVGGTQVKSNEWIGQRTVGLLKKGSITCSATLLSSKVALTAAHCIYDSRRDYELGFNVKVNSSGIVKRKVTKIVVHPNYDNTFTTRNPSDIALVFFSGGMPKSHKNVVLAGATQVPKRGTAVTIAGYGANKRNGSSGYGILRKANVKVFEASASESEVELDQKDSGAACYGDSGGPVYRSDPEDTYNQLGIASRVTLRRENGEDVCGNFATYTRVGFFLKWIEKEIAQ